MKSALGKSAAMEPYYQELVKQDYFDTMKDVMLLAIVIGFKNKTRVPIGKYGGDSIKEHIFKDDMDFLNTIAVLSTGDIKILLDESKDEKYKRFEEYAEAGMNIFVKEVFNGQVPNADMILEFVKKYAPTVHDAPQDFSDFFGDIIEEMTTEE